MDKTYSKIFKITKKGKSNVYDFTVDETHRILANNFYTSNCHVKHPDAEDFIDAKMTQGKVTGANVSVKLDDEFMKCVIEEKPYIQKYPIDSDNPIFTKEIDAKKLWKKIIYNAWKSAEPGLLFWDTVIKESVPDCYTEHGFKTVSTNPCVVGDTKISVADGRMGVTIKELAEESKDVPVYCLDNNGELAIRIMRNPRITGYNKQIYKITLDNGQYIRVTGNHKFRLKNGTYIEAKDLKNGDSLDVFSKVIINNNKRKNNYYTLVNNSNSYLEHRMVSEFNNGRKLNENEVVHHIDYNGLNNNINNLKIMTIDEHNSLHRIDKLGNKNPYHRMSDEWKFNFASRKGDTNNKFCGIYNDEIKEHFIKLTKKLNRRISKKDWVEYAKENNLPQYFSSYRRNYGGDIVSLAKLVSLELNIDNNFVDVDPRIVKTYKKSLSEGYNSKIDNNSVIVEKQCEHCGELFWVDYQKREISFCSQKCANVYINTDKNIKLKRKISINDTYKQKMINIKNKQMDIFKKLEFNLKRCPKLKEWEKECKLNNIPYRLKTKYGYQTFSDIKKESEYYNHRVISIELDGFENVYNGTVDDFHNFFSGEFEETTKTNNKKYVYINQLNCGEIPLNVGDSCRLLALNLYSYVENPFTKDAKFNYDLFKEHVIYAQRFMDDIVDLEIEKIDQILNKIDNDPEPEHIKRVERELWKLIKDNAVKGRRTGLGITSEGDMIAAMGLIYGTSEATDFAENIHKILATYAYKSSIIMAEERGSFTVFNKDNEKNNPFVNRVLNSLKEFKENDIIEKYNKTGRRNISLLTIAPTGSVSIVTQTTSGIEPVFLPSYTRRRKINPNDKNTKTSFIDEVGDHWEEYNVFHHKFKTWAEINGYDTSKLETMKQSELDDIIKKSPYFKATSNDVNWVEKVRMQGKIQKWVDHSISVTINLPSDVTEELVSQVYQTGWESGCKGITVYRDGSRSGVLITKTDNKKANIFQENNAPKRPESLQCDVYRFQNKGDKWIGFMGLLDNKPYEIFTGLQESVNIPNNITKGEIKKVKSAESDGHSRYDFIYIDKDGYKQEFRGLSRAFNREFWNTGRLISAVLRHGMPLPNVLQIMDKLIFDSDDVITSWKQGIKRIIKKYIKEGTLVKGQTCDVCGSSNIVFKEGCMTCMDCGTSKCE
ncbi:MAG: HNH endonuclease [Trichloromonas sp.]|nr:HNH endonuclease [Trichloromonas sp.]